VTFPASEIVAVFGGADGALHGVVATPRFGLRHPCGIVLDGGGEHWLVTGHERGFMRITTADLSAAVVAPEPRWWGHSHSALL